MEFAAVPFSHSIQFNDWESLGLEGIVSAT